MQTQLKVRTEFSFGWTYGPVKKVVDRLKELDCKAAAITDRNSVFGHVQWNKYCKAAGIKPLFGVELAFIHDINERQKRQNLFWIPIIARNNAGLKEIYSAVEEASSHYYNKFIRLPFNRLQDFSQDVIVLSGNSGLGPSHKIGCPYYGEGHSATAPWILNGHNIVPVSDNFMIVPSDRSAYEILARRNSNNRPSPMHILDEWSLRNEIDLDDSCFDLANRLAEECNAEIQIATNIKYKSDKTLRELCLEGCSWRQLELNDEYAERLNKELDLIQSKGFEDYFFVIADLVTYAKRHMLVGPARGSSCGSLVCYLLGITDIDPIPHGLIFERFIDVTRHDLPDIDIDFQDTKREMVFDYLIDKYGTDNVARLGTVLRYKPKSAIGQAAKSLSVPDFETKGLKDSMLKRSSGDSRAMLCIMDTFSELEIGKKFIEKYPAMKIAGDLEGHASTTGKHAAGVIITNEPIVNYVARDVRTNTTHLDKWDAELVNLMKIDALGLKTLSIIDDTLKAIGWTYDQLLKHPLDDDKAFEVLRKFQFCGIFQFEGQALQTLARRLHVDRFDDIACLTALARPGPFASGASNTWVNRRMGKEPVTFIHPSMERYTKDTYGIIVYQEQVMNCVREIGLLTWEDTSTLRKAMSKSFGVEYFDKFWQRFREGATSQGIDEDTAKKIWDSVNKMGSWAFNKSHAVAYGTLSYFCCVLKAHFPIEFALANIRNFGFEDSIKRYLRELDRAGYGFKTYDLEKSDIDWTFKDGYFLGGLINIKGIGPKKAQQILLARSEGRDYKWPEEITTPYDNTFEGRDRIVPLVDEKFNLKTPLADIWNMSEKFEGQIRFIAKVVHRNERSLNEAMFLVQRNNIIVPNDKWLTLLLENDQGNVYATISRFKYPSMGIPMINDYQIGDWFLFKGLVREGRRITIEEYRYLSSGVATTFEKSYKKH